MTARDLSPDRLAEIEQRHAAAVAELDRMTSARGGPGQAWRWSIPANPERDSDLILSACIADLADLLVALAAKDAEVSKALESARKLFVEGRDLRIRAEAAEQREADLRAKVRGLAESLTEEIEELRGDLPPVGPSLLAQIYRTAGLSESRDRLAALLDAPTSEEP